MKINISCIQHVFACVCFACSSLLILDTGASCCSIICSSFALYSCCLTIQSVVNLVLTCAALSAISAGFVQHCMIDR